MGLVANYPIGLAPGMGQNAFFTYAVVVGSGHPGKLHWEQYSCLVFYLW